MILTLSFNKMWEKTEKYCNGIEYTRIEGTGCPVAFACQLIMIYCGSFSLVQASTQHFDKFHWKF
jgi:hypothetical protein